MSYSVPSGVVVSNVYAIPQKSPNFMKRCLQVLLYRRTICKSFFFIIVNIFILFLFLSFSLDIQMGQKNPGNDFVCFLRGIHLYDVTYGDRSAKIWWKTANSDSSRIKWNNIFLYSLGTHICEYYAQIIFN